MFHLDLLYILNSMYMWHCKSYLLLVYLSNNDLECTTDAFELGDNYLLWT